MITEAIILAGGKGTRLQSEISEFPKSMAPINGIPFLSYQFDFLLKHEIKTVYLAVGYLSEVIQNFYGNSYLGMTINYVYEKEPLGTGGAISQALSYTITNDILVLNGDSLFHIDIHEFYKFHQSKIATCSLALKHFKNFDRYGVVQSNIENKIIGFEEKQEQTEGDINGGVYLLNKSQFLSLTFPRSYSFEKEYLETYLKNHEIFGYPSQEYFLDIGIPEDYFTAQKEFAHLKPWNIDSSWTLFLDRDGVINKQIKGGYVTDIESFQFLDGALNALSELSRIFGRIIVVTNQQCIGKKIITTQQLDKIHSFMVQQIKEKGGHINKVYFAPNLSEENSPMRKPNSGMADKAKEDFPSIDFHKSIIVGDSISDIEFGKNKNMKTVLITNELISFPDRCFRGLKDFSKSIS